jgi:hypothetical protein
MKKYQGGGLPFKVSKLECINVSTVIPYKGVIKYKAVFKNCLKMHLFL